MSLVRHPRAVGGAHPRWGLLAVLAAAGAVSPCSAAAVATGAELAGNSSIFACHAPEDYRPAYLAELVRQNCEKVRRIAKEYTGVGVDKWHVAREDFLLRGGTAAVQQAKWVSQGEEASEVCRAAGLALAVNTSESLRKAADLAINAWGSVIMGGKECCTLVRAPYCVDMDISASGIFLFAPFAMLLALLAGSFFASFLVRRKRAGPLPEELLTEPSAPAPHSAMSSRRAELMSWLARAPWKLGPPRITIELEKMWMQGSCLKALPEAKRFAFASAGLFGALSESFDFQADSVHNQYEHLLSMWRSQCALVADRSLQAGDAVEESGLLEEALGDLNAELLEGFHCWRAKLCACELAGVPAREPAEPPALGGAMPPEAAEASSVQLAEVAAFLLVWGEAGNLRFMPELLYFITELVLASEAKDLGELYDGGTKVGARSGFFLSRVVRPIYAVIFNEWYERVEVDAGNCRDKKKLHPGLENFLPPDVANYDDWNEFFADPERLTQGLLLRDGRHLFEEPHSRRFAALAQVDWQLSLEAAATKTHREVHSLWGVFASTHRILLLHAILFFSGVCAVAGDPPATSDGRPPLGGRGTGIRFAAVGLLVPVHALLRSFALWHVSGCAARDGLILSGGPSRFCWRLLQMAGWSLPLVTYALVRCEEEGWASFLPQGLRTSISHVARVVHFSVSFLGLSLLLRPDGSYNTWNLTSVSLGRRVVRYTFWFCVLATKFLLGVVLFGAVHQALVELDLAMPTRQSPAELGEVYLSTGWGENVLLWLVVWSGAFLLFLADTQLWFTIACSVLGVWVFFVQRGCRGFSYAFEDAVAKIPERFSAKVLVYAAAPMKLTSNKHKSFSVAFPLVWDRIVHYMRYEDKIDNHLMGDLCFEGGDAEHHVCWEHLNKPLVGGGAKTSGERDDDSVVSKCASSRPTSRKRVKVPHIFNTKSYIERFFKRSCGVVPDPHWPSNVDVRWRIQALGRGLGASMPRPFRAPYMPGLTVLIPHYGESILMLRKELFHGGQEDIVPLIDWVKQHYGDEFAWFTDRMQSKNSTEWPVVGSQWGEYTEAEWEKISAWSAMRLQTLWRTVAGMCLYHAALQAHYEVQGDKCSALGKPDIWDPSDCFTCLVSMQMYKFFDVTQLMHTNRMLAKFPKSLKVAYIDCEDKGQGADIDQVHPQQRRRYFSCLMDATCEELSGGMRKPRFRVELPGYPILGDGKGDNQNHAIPFMRGTFAQCIDANQGAYFEQMMLLPCALGEFRSRKRGDGGSKRIVGFPEHITSDIGSIGDFAASAEVAFGTILQRSYLALGARMHYGHPDIMNKLYMMQQGGVSKATKTLNLSEDIFAGMDFTLRGEGREILHREYFHLAKGRDLGFNTVLGFFSKLSSGTGEQIITRQAFRLGQALHLPEALTFYYAHAGYYFTQFLVSWSMPLLVFVWLLVLLSDCEGGSFEAFQRCSKDATASAVAARALAVPFSWLILLFLAATSLPLFMEIWLEQGVKTAMSRVLKQVCTLSPLLFIFQAKVIGHYVVNELRYGGATYVSTGRGLPTERRPFIGEASAGGRFRLEKVGGLYLDYAAICYYDGAALLVCSVLVLVVGGSAAASVVWVWFSIGLTVISWLFAPFIFNPYQFVGRYFLEDLRCIVAFFLQDSGRHWVEWYDRTQLKPRGGQGVSFFVASFFLIALYATMNTKVRAISVVFSESFSVGALHAVMLPPPMGLSLCYCLLAVAAESLAGCSSILHRRLRRRRPRRKPVCSSGRRWLWPGHASAKGPEGGAAVEEDGEVTSSEDEERPHVAVVDHLVGPAPPPRAMSFMRKGTEASGCKLGIPLAFSALIVLVLDAVEAFAALRLLMGMGWKNTFLAGLLLKWGLLQLCLLLGEGLLRSRCYGGFGLPLQLWLRAHRMARDILTSSLIFLAMMPFVLLNSLNDCLCPGCSVHQILLYRDPGHLARREAIETNVDMSLGKSMSAFFV